MQATIFPHEDGVSVWFSGLADDPEAHIEEIERKYGIELPCMWYVWPRDHDSITPPHIHAACPGVVMSSSHRSATGQPWRPSSARIMQDPASGLPRILLPRTRVNNGERKGRLCRRWIRSVT